MRAWQWIAGVLTALAWFYLARGRGAFWKPGPFLEPEPEPERWPSVCAVVPARDEALAVLRSLPALLAQDYPGSLRVVFVDDHSSDGTDRLAREAAARFPEPSCSVVQAAPLPPGWTGKLWALECGARYASSESDAPDYFFLTDCDILHPRGSVKGLVAKAESAGLDLASLMARLRSERFWERLLIPAFVFFFQKLYPFAWSNDPSAKTAAAAGGCILIKENALKRIGGLASIRGELIDDCALAAAVKRSGGKIWIGHSETVESLRSYGSIKPIWDMVARTAFTQLRYSWPLLLAAAAGMVWLYVGPFATLAFGIVRREAAPALWGAAGFGTMSLLYLPTVRFYRVSTAYAFCLPFIAVLYAAMTLDSGFRHLRRRGGKWKGRAYPPSRPDEQRR